MNKAYFYNWSKEETEALLDALNDEMKAAHEGEPVNWHTIHDAMAYIEGVHLRKHYGEEGE